MTKLSAVSVVGFVLYCSATYGATVTVLGPEVFVRESGSPVMEGVAFSVPVAGAATVRVANGTEDDANSGERVSSSVILLNGVEVLGPDSFSQTVSYVEVPVWLLQGENILSVELRAKPGGRIFVSILTPADTISLSPVPEPLIVDGDPLVAEAVVTGLGIPAVGAEVLFEVTGLGVIPSVSATTDADGVATVSIGGFDTVGVGTLSAVVNSASPPLSDSTPVEVISGTQISLDQGLSSLRVDAGSSRNVAYAVKLDPHDATTYSVNFVQTVEPSSPGISMFDDYPVGGWSSSTSQTWLVNSVVHGLEPGTYTVTTTATIIETGDSVSSELTVIVDVPGIPGQLVILPLGSEPDGISVGTTTPVTFCTLVTGTETPPGELVLTEIDESDNLVDILGSLKDDGTGGDLVSGDFVYSGTFSISGLTEGSRIFRAGSDQGGTMIYSDPYSLVITRFPIGSAPFDTLEVIEDPSSGAQFVANEILVSFHEGILPDRIEEIVAEVNGTVIGYLPSLGFFQVWIAGDGTVDTVLDALDAIRSYAEVRIAEVNGVMQADAVEPDGSIYENRGQVQVRADEAWVVARADSSIIVAVLDSGVDHNHDDLKDHVIDGYNFADNSEDTMDYKGHGTHVAGIIGASLDGVGMTGIAFGCKIMPIKVSHGFFDMTPIMTASEGIRSAVDRGAKVINMSINVPIIDLFSNAPKVLHEAVRYAHNHGRLIVASAGNNGNDWGIYPAIFDEVMAVGNTRKNDDRDDRWDTSNYGVWVDIAAPGYDIYSTVSDHDPINNATSTHYDYGYKTGTSMSAPMVSGAAAVVWAMHPSWTAAQVRERLEKTAKRFSDANHGWMAKDFSSANYHPLGSGRLDLFEAVFNGSFEIGDLSEWEVVGTVSSFEELGELTPRHGRRMGYASTGPAGDQVAASLTKAFTVQEGVTSIPIAFEYDFITEEYPEWVGTIYDDKLRITLTAPDGTEHLLALETVNTSSFSLIYTIPLSGVDGTVGHTGWKPVQVTIPVTAGAGEYKIRIEDTGDDIFDSVVLIDNIRLKHP